LLKQSGLDEGTAVAALEELETTDQLVRLGQQLLSRAGWQRKLDQLIGLLDAYHRSSSLRLGMPREELRSRLKLNAAVFNPLMVQAAADGLLQEEGSVVRAPDHAIVFSAAQQTAVDNLLRQMKAAGVNSPSVKECKAAVGEAVYWGLVDLGELRPLDSDVVYAAADYAHITKKIKQYLQENGQINAAQTRDLLQTSRKYAIGLLEHLDHIKVTRRIGDNRELV
jgi:selenocysteine-specific elongation factor